jgi:hypothetical protein
LIINLDNPPHLIYNWVFKRDSKRYRSLGMRWTEMISPAVRRGICQKSEPENTTLQGLRERLNFGEPLTSSLSPSLVTVIANREARAGSM